MKEHTRTILKRTVESILKNPMQHEWTVQGLGMLRMYLRRDCRLHIWTKDSRVKDVSELHTHPWNFRSTIIAGKILNNRYIELSPDGSPIDCNHGEYYRQELACGTGGGLVGYPIRTRLQFTRQDVFGEGRDYFHHAADIHASDPLEGTVTIIQRINHRNDMDRAYVYWPIGKQWISAEPRKATEEEIITACGIALDQWFND